MITTTTIKALAYPVKLKDHRTGKHLEDTIVLPKEWLQICGSDGLNICDDKHMIYRAYNLKGFEVLEIGKRHKVQLTVDLSQLYRDHVAQECNELMQSITMTEENEITLGEIRAIYEAAQKDTFWLVCHAYAYGFHRGHATGREAAV